MADQSIPKSKRICQVEGCDRKYYVKGFCVRHYMQMKKHGEIFGNPKKLKRGEFNRYVFDGDICKIELYDKEGSVKDHAIIDTEDYKKVKNIKWSLDGYGYVCCSKRDGTCFKLHRVVLGLSESKKNPDHIDNDPLNNRKLNLRICTQHQNTCNNKKQKNNTSGYKGVSRDKSKNKWRARIKVNYKEMHLGIFENKIDAAKAYNRAAIKYFGEFAKLNHLQIDCIDPELFINLP